MSVPSSRTCPPINPSPDDAILHNTLSGIQGGVPSEHYHLTLEEKAKLSSSSEGFEERVNKGEKDGYAPLDGGSKVPLRHLPSSVVNPPTSPVGEAPTDGKAYNRKDARWEEDIVGVGTIPVGGIKGNPLTKNSDVNHDVQWGGAILDSGIF